MGGDPGEVHAAAAVLDHDEDVETMQEHGIDVGEVDGEDRVGLRDQELPPGRAGPLRCGSMPAAVTFFRTVDAAIRWPRPTSSSWVRRRVSSASSARGRASGTRVGRPQ
jgi:hypothetical protein